MTYQLPFFIVSLVCVCMVIVMYFRERELKDWRNEYRRMVQEQAKFLMMNKNEKAYYEATREEPPIDPEKQQKFNEKLKKQQKHDEIYRTGIISEEDMADYDIAENIIQ